MRKIYVSDSVLTQAKKLRRKLWLSLIPLSPMLIIVFLDQDPEGFTAYTGLTSWQGFAISTVFTFTGIWYARRIWRCPVCNEYLGDDIFTKFCPHCATYVAIPQSTSPVYTADENLFRGAALIPAEEFSALEASERQKSLIKRYRLQIITSLVITVLFAGLGIMADIQAERLENKFQFGPATIQMIVLYTVGTFSFCWCAIFLFYFDEWLLSRYNNRATRVLMRIYGNEIIKLAFTFLGGLALTVVTFGIFGLWVFFRTRTALKLLTAGLPVGQPAPNSI